MSRALYIGDETHAAGWRLAGIEVRVVAADSDIDALFASACADADLLLMSAASAARLSAARLNLAQRALSPLLLVLPATSASVGSSELAQRVRSQLGMES